MCLCYSASFCCIMSYSIHRSLTNSSWYLWESPRKTWIWKSSVDAILLVSSARSCTLVQRRNEWNMLGWGFICMGQMCPLSSVVELKRKWVSVGGSVGGGVEWNVWVVLQLCVITACMAVANISIYSPRINCTSLSVLYSCHAPFVPCLLWTCSFHQPSTDTSSTSYYQR